MREAPAERLILAMAAGLLGHARRVLQQAGPGLLAGFGMLAIALWTFGELGVHVLQRKPFALDATLLHAAHSVSGPGLDAVSVAVSAVGYAWGVVPADVLLALGLAAARRFSRATFAALATGGAGLLNFVAKNAFARERPALWPSIAPETTYSFPSGHAMASATLACVLVVLAWRTRARLPVLVAAVLFTLAVGASRVYLGVHYPSDILAGWAAAIAWTLFAHAMVRRASAHATVRRGGRGRDRP